MSSKHAKTLHGKTAFVAAMVVFSVAFAGISRAESADSAPSTVTIETTQGAIFISGPKDKASAVRNDLASIGAEGWPLEKIANYIAEKFPGELDAQVFRRSDAAALEDAENLEMPLRRAILIGLAPPVEGLSEKDAIKVLEAVGISAFTKAAWEAMDQRERASRLSSSSGQIIILNAAQPQETVRIILVKTDKVNSAGRGAE